ncbi:MAG: hypothetical protein ABSG43_14625 [Solirubrobacteraceae bacterium]|jgi:hypothetical protein
MQLNLKRKFAIGTSVLAAAALAGGAYAATQSGGNARQAFLNDVAKRLNVSPSQLGSALQGAFSDQLQAAVAAGKITQAQANAIEQRAQHSGGPPLGFGPGSRGFGLRGGAALRLLPAAASYLGLTGAQLRQQLSAGKSLAQIATAQGKTAAGLEAAITAATRSRLDKLVASKAITSAQAQRLLARLSSALDSEINRTGMAPRLGGTHQWFGARRPGIGMHSAQPVPGAFGGAPAPAPAPAPANPVA